MTRPELARTGGLVILGGLSGVGKTTLARALARRLGAVHLRVDSIEWAIVRSGLTDDVGGAGYAVAYAIAADQLSLGHVVVADTVNPIALTRQAWREVAVSCGLPVAEVELVCSDEGLHQRRATERRSDIQGAVLPTWQEIADRYYEKWEPDLVLDMALIEPEAGVDLLLSQVPWMKRGTDTVIV